MAGPGDSTVWRLLPQHFTSLAFILTLNAFWKDLVGVLHFGQLIGNSAKVRPLLMIFKFWTLQALLGEISDVQFCCRDRRGTADNS